MKMENAEKRGGREYEENFIHILLTGLFMFEFEIIPIILLPLRF